MREEIGDRVGDRSRKGNTSKGVRRCEGGVKEVGLKMVKEVGWKWRW